MEFSLNYRVSLFFYKHISGVTKIDSYMPLKKVKYILFCNVFFTNIRAKFKATVNKCKSSVNACTVHVSELSVT